MSPFFFAWIWPTLLKQPALIVSGICIPLVLVIGQIALPWFTRDLLNAIQNDANLIQPTCWLLLCWSGAKIIVRAQVFYTAKASVSFMQTLRAYALRDILKLPFSQRIKRSEASWTQLILDLAKSIECIYGLMVWDVLPTIGLFIFILIEVYQINHLFFWTYLAYVILQLALISRYKNQLYQECQKQSMLKNQLIDDLQHLLINPWATTKHMTTQICRHFGRLSATEMQSRKQLILKFNFARTTMDCLAIGVFTLSILIIITRHQSWVLGDLSFIFMTLMSTIERAWSLGQNWCELQRSISLLVNHQWLMDAPNPAIPNMAYLHATKYTLQIESLSFAYPNKTMFTNFSFKLPPHDFCGLSAESGEGKSTLFKIISGQLTPSAGQIMINQSPILDLTLNERQQIITLLSQTHLFFKHLSITDNLHLHHNPDNARMPIEEALFQAGCHLWPKHWFTLKANHLSSGQKQQLNLALALLNAAPIWLIDEAFSCLDAKTHAWIMQQLKRHKQIKKIIMVSHQARDHVYFDCHCKLASAQIAS